MAKFLNIANRRFAKLTAVRHVGFNSHRKAMWLCKCDCGLEVIVVGGNLISGGTTSCGCEQRRLASDRMRQRNFKHGHATGSFSPEYRAFTSMHRRCKYPSVAGYKNYGGRGIRVCKRWSSFQNFFRDMGPKPAMHTLERKNPDGDYKPSNCKWATNLEQQRNRRNTRYVVLDGERIALAALCERFNMDYDAVRNRLDDGWGVEMALTEPIRKRSGLQRQGRHRLAPS